MHHDASINDYSRVPISYSHKTIPQSNTYDLVSKKI